MSSYDASVALDRKLTAEETRELKISLMPYFVATGDTEASPEDINDLLDYAFAMVNNQKTVEYVIQELVGMEMEFCNATVAEKVGSELSAFLKKIMGVEEPAPKIASLKSSSEKGNALTMSGALGASREGGRNKNNNEKKSDNKKKDDRRGGDRNNNKRGDRNNDRGNNRGRSTHKEAFDRLSGGKNDRRGRRDDDRSGRGGRGRRDDDRGGRGGRGGRRDGGRGGRGDRGNRRSRDEYEEPAADQDFVPMGRGGGRGRGGRGDGHSKRPRYDDQGYNGGYYDEGYGYDDGYGYGGYHGYGGRGFYRGGRGRGRFGGRGRGRGGRGRGGPPPEGGAEGGEAAAAGNQEGAPATPAGDAAHPSPLVQANYSGGRGYGGRGRFGGRWGGRGRGGGGRAHVVSMIQSKTWVRKKPEDAAGGDANPPDE